MLASAKEFPVDRGVYDYLLRGYEHESQRSKV